MKRFTVATTIAISLLMHSTVLAVWDTGNYEANPGPMASVNIHTDTMANGTMLFKVTLAENRGRKTRMPWQLYLMTDKPVVVDRLDFNIRPNKLLVPAGWALKYPIKVGALDLHEIYEPPVDEGRGDYELQFSIQGDATKFFVAVENA